MTGHVELLVKDMNETRWSLYAYIHAQAYKEDLDDIVRRTAQFRQALTEIVDYHGNVVHFYRYLRARDLYEQNSVLQRPLWQALQAKGDDHFLILHQGFGPTYHETAEHARGEHNYAVFDSWHDVLRKEQPDMHRMLQENGALPSFDIANYYSGRQSTMLTDGRVVFTWKGEHA